MSPAARSLTLRITLLFAATSTAVLLALGALVVRAVDEHFIELDTQQLAGKLHLVESLLASGERDTLSQRLDAALVGHHGMVIQVLDANDETIYTTAHISADARSHAADHATDRAAFPPALLASPATGVPFTWRESGHAWRGLIADVPGGSPGAVLRVAVAVDIAHHEHFMASFRRSLWLFVLLAALLTGLLGWWSVRRGLAPLRAMRDEAENVSARHLDRRLDEEAVPPELAELARTLNAMLLRLQQSFQQLTDFSSDLAHELRTPVNALMTATQVALGRARTAEEYRDVLAANMEEYERLARTISDMLFLAQAEHGLLVPGNERVELAQQVRELFEFFEALAAEKSLRLSITGSGGIGGDTLMLRRALANLLANAIRHAKAAGEVRVAITHRDAGIALSVENDGEPIAEDHLPRLFDRFYRADPSRHREGEGAGLGLAITRAIVRAHGGDIAAANGPGVVRFTIFLPARQDAVSGLPAR